MHAVHEQRPRHYGRGVLGEEQVVHGVRIFTLACLRLEAGLHLGGAECRYGDAAAVQLPA